MHTPSALSDFSEFSKKSKDRKLGVGVVDGCGGDCGGNSIYDYILLLIHIKFSKNQKYFTNLRVDLVLKRAL